MAARFGFSEDTVRLAAALRPALASRGVPELSMSITGQRSSIRGCCGVRSLSIKLVHSAPGRPRAEARSRDSPHRP